LPTVPPYSSGVGAALFADGLRGQGFLVQGADALRPDDLRAADAIRSAIAEIIGSALGVVPGRVEIVSRDPLLTVLVTGTRTPLEGVLLSAGAADLVRRGRDALRKALEGPLRSAVERALGEPVGALSGSHDPPSSTETLLFDVESPPGLIG
jgi:hypothetical protein